MVLETHFNREEIGKVTILAIDDAPDILLMLEFELSEEGFKVVTADSGSSGLQILKEQSIDLVLLDIVMPEQSGLDVLNHIRTNELYSDIPVIMLSASEQSDDIVQALDLGANDFVTKPYLSKVLLARIRNALRLQIKNKMLEKMALTDYLTGINNRRNFYHLSAASLNRNKRQKTSLCIAILDIDHFKKVNDSYGHDIGDQVLVNFATVFKKFFRDYDIVGRVGGEEFAICLIDAKLEEGIRICDRFRNELSKEFIEVDNNGQSVHIQTCVSIGITETSECLEVEQLIKQADEALYRAKQGGRDQVCGYRP